MKMECLADQKRSELDPTTQVLNDLASVLLPGEWGVPDFRARSLDPAMSSRFCGRTAAHHFGEEQTMFQSDWKKVMIGYDWRPLLPLPASLCLLLLHRIAMASSPATSSVPRPCTPLGSTAFGISLPSAAGPEGDRGRRKSRPGALRVADCYAQPCVWGDVKAFWGKQSEIFLSGGLSWRGDSPNC